MNSRTSSLSRARHGDHEITLVVARHGDQLVTALLHPIDVGPGQDSRRPTLDTSRPASPKLSRCAGDRSTIASTASSTRSRASTAPTPDTAGGLDSTITTAPAIAAPEAIASARTGGGDRSSKTCRVAGSLAGVESAGLESGTGWSRLGAGLALGAEDAVPDSFAGHLARPDSNAAFVCSPRIAHGPISLQGS